MSIKIPCGIILRKNQLQKYQIIDSILLNVYENKKIKKTLAKIQQLWYYNSRFKKYAGVSELADEADSKSVVGNNVWVQVPSPAVKNPSFKKTRIFLCAGCNTEVGLPTLFYNREDLVTLMCESSFLLHRSSHLYQISVQVVKSNYFLSPAVCHKPVDIFNRRIQPFELLDKGLYITFFKI